MNVRRRARSEAEMALRSWIARRLRQHRASLRMPPADKQARMRWRWMNHTQALLIEKGYARLHELEQTRSA